MNAILVSYSNFSTDGRLKNYAKILAEAGYSVYVFCLDDGRRVNLNGVTLIHCGIKYRGKSLLVYLKNHILFFSKTLFFLALWIVKGRRIVAVHINNMPNYLVFTALPPKLFGAKVLLDNHDCMPVVYESKFNKGSNKLVRQMLMLEQKVSNVFADITLCADHNQKDYLVSCGVRESQLHVFMNIPDEMLFRKVTNKRKGIIFRIIYHGTITKRLGIDLAVEAVSIVSKKCPNVVLRIIGDGDFKNTINIMVKDLGLETLVKVEGPVPFEDLPRVIGTMDLGIIPNRKTQATDMYMLPVKLLEYVCLGIPVVAPRLRIIQRYFDEKMIKYYEPGNVNDMARCIVEICENESVSCELAKNAEKFTRKFTWEKQKEKYLEIFKNTQ